MRRRYVMRQGELVEIGANASQAPQAPEVRRDLMPYRSMHTGEIIDGRRAHREHLKRHDLIEVGNERAGFDRGPVDPLGPGEIAAEIKRVLQRPAEETAAVARRVLHEAGYEGPAIERLLRPPR